MRKRTMAALFLVFPVALTSVCTVCFDAGAKDQASAVQWWLSVEQGPERLAPQPPLSWSIPTKKTKRTQESIVIDPNERYQTILGFGASFDHATCWNLMQLPESLRRETLRRLVSSSDGIGMNLMRICIGTSDFTPEPWYSYDDVPDGETDVPLRRFSIEKDRKYVLPILRMAKAENPDLLYFASPWSPPGWMKTSGRMEGGSLREEYFQVYAKYLAEFVEAYAGEGIPLYAMTVQNEPAYEDPHYPTCFWTVEAYHRFIRDALVPTFQKRGITVPVWGWDHNWNTLEYAEALLRDPVCRTVVKGTGFHLYEGKVTAQTELHKKFPGVPIYFTEGSTYGARGAAQIIEILKNWACSYNAWVTMLDENRQPNRGPHHADPTCVVRRADNTVEYRFDYYMYGHFSKFIPRGSVRIRSSGGPLSVEHAAFLTPDGRCVLVVVNLGKSTCAISVRMGDRMFPASLAPKSLSTFCF